MKDLNQAGGERQAILIVGMHRSGTSALTRVIHLHGVPLGQRLAGPALDNKAGFWENVDVVDLHERILQSLGSAWDDLREFPPGWESRDDMQGYKDELHALIDKEFEDAPLWAVKDPRLCRFLPLWRDVLAQRNIEPKLILCLRHPEEVVASLEQRNHLLPGGATILWLRYLSESVAASAGCDRSLVAYDDLLADWRTCLDRVARELDIDWPIASVDCADAVNRHLQKGLRHQRAEERLQWIPPQWRDMVMGIHELAMGLTKGKTTWHELDDAIHEAWRHFEFVDPIWRVVMPKSQADEREHRLSLVQHELESSQATVFEARKELTKAYEMIDAERGRLHVMHEQFLRVDKELVTERAELERSQAALSAEKSRMAQVQDELSVEKAKLVRIEDELSVEKAKSVRMEDELSAEKAKSVRMEDELSVEKAKSAQVQVELSVEKAKSVQMQDDLFQTQNELARQAARAAMLDQLLASRSWRWTRPLRFAARVLRYRGVSASDRQQLMRMKDAKVPKAFTPGLPDISSQKPLWRDYFVWAVIDWHYRIQRPQHLARELARMGHRVFYISNNFIDRSEPGFRVESLDETNRLFQINLNLKSSPAIYHAPPGVEAQAQLRASLGRLLEWTESRGVISMVDHPYWLEVARIVPDSRLLYDCMDHHGGFADNSEDILSREHELMRDADLLVVTSDWLKKETARYNPRSVTIRNACEYEHFAHAPQEQFEDVKGRKIIGYYGAIAEWFDLELVEKVARHFDDCLVLLVGMDVADVAGRRLGALPNVQFTGEVPYAELPYYLYAFDVCMLPFKVIPLTLATNPVKVYEYLSAGRHVVSVDLPEISQFGELVDTAADHDDFIRAIAHSLDVPPSGKQVRARQQFAAEQTWEHRVRDLDASVKALPFPRVSVVVVTYNNLDFTKACMQSLYAYNDYPNMEVIVVDNASSDGTTDYLRDWVGQGEDRHVILNQDNRGFAAANNQGLARADGDYLVMLNNDTYVTPGWLATLMGHMRRDPSLGMLGPVTNNIGNEARIDINYANMDEMLQASGAYTRQHVGQLFPLRTAAFFCVMMPRHVYEAVGDLDEAFGIGMFEDDDYCRRVEQHGWTIACADDVFIHHHLSASFGKVKQEKRKQMFEKNKAIYEAKWGAWVPHKYR